MKLLCIKNDANKKTIYKWITPGKIYDGSDYSKTQYMIRDDNGEVSLYPKKNFQTIEEIRDEKINNIITPN